MCWSQIYLTMISSSHSTLWTVLNIPFLFVFTHVYKCMFIYSLVYTGDRLHSRAKMESTSNNSTIDAMLQDIEDFVYTPYGVATVAALAFIITSLIWLLGCCIYCCCRYRTRRGQGGVAEAGGELRFVNIGSNPGHTPNNGYTGTGSSGYHSHAGTMNHSVTSFHDGYDMTNSSMDSILERQH